MLSNKITAWTLVMINKKFKHTDKMMLMMREGSCHFQSHDCLSKHSHTISNSLSQSVSQSVISIKNQHSLSHTHTLSLSLSHMYSSYSLSPQWHLYTHIWTSPKNHWHLQTVSKTQTLLCQKQMAASSGHLWKVHVHLFRNAVCLFHHHIHENSQQRPGQAKALQNKGRN